MCSRETRNCNNYLHLVSTAVDEAARDASSSAPDDEAPSNSDQIYIQRVSNEHRKRKDNRRYYKPACARRIIEPIHNGFLIFRLKQS